MLDLSMHILDIVENSINAGADVVLIELKVETQKDTFSIEIQDNGSGMDDEMLKKALDPFMTTKPGKRVGLGLSMLREASRKSGGDMSVDSQPGVGTAVHATFGLTHVDRQPLGNLPDTMLTLIIGNVDVAFGLTLKMDEKTITWNTGMIHEKFGDRNRTDPEVMTYIREQIEFFRQTT